MAMIVKNRQHKGMKYREVTYNEDPITQSIKAVKGNKLTVMSRRLRTYDVVLSAELIGSDIEVGDTAVIATLKKGWKVIDVIKQEKPQVLSAEEEAKELERQMKEFEDMFGGY